MNTLNFTFNFNAPVGQNIAHVDRLEAHFDKDMTMQVVDTATLEASPRPSPATPSPYGYSPLKRGEFRGMQTSLNEERLVCAIEAVQSFFWAQSAWAVVYCVCRDHLGVTESMTDFERRVETFPFTKRVVECPAGTVQRTISNNEYMKYSIHRWGELGAKSRAILLAEKLVEAIG